MTTGKLIAILHLRQFYFVSHTNNIDMQCTIFENVRTDAITNTDK